MDIQYLLFLQDFRNGISDSLTPFMEFISSAATNYLILIPIFFYWFIDRRKGLYALGSHWGKLLFSVIHVFFYIALFPLILKLIGKLKPDLAA